MKYHKINSIFKRDMTKPNKPFIVGEWSQPEFAYLSENEWEWTEKVDGTNIRIMLDGDEVEFGGRTDNAQIPAHLVNKLQELFITNDRKDALRGVFEQWSDITIFGEGFGYKIQNGGEYLGKDVDFCLFDIRIGNWWLNRTDVEGIGEKLGLKVAPVVGSGTIAEAIEYVMSEPDSVFGTAKSEGLVIRPAVELANRGGQRIITKIKVRDFVS